MSASVAIYLGHSHTGAIFHAFDRRRAEGVTSAVSHRAYNIWASDLATPYVVDQDDARVINPVVTEEIALFFEPGDAVVYVSLFGGNVHNVMGLLQACPDYDLILPGDPPVRRDADRPILPLRMVEARIHAENVDFLEQISVLRAHTTGRVLHLQSPPPIKDRGYIETTLDEHFKRQAFKPVVSRSALRKALWRVHSSIVEAHCNALGVKFLPCPPEALTSDGFLAEPFWGNATHANAVYGELLLRQVEQACADGG